MSQLRWFGLVMKMPLRLLPFKMFWSGPSGTKGWGKIWASPWFRFILVGPRVSPLRLIWSSWALLLRVEACNFLLSLLLAECWTITRSYFLLCFQSFISHSFRLCVHPATPSAAAAWRLSSILEERPFCKHLSCASVRAWSDSTCCWLHLLSTEDGGGSGIRCVESSSAETREI